MGTAPLSVNTQTVLDSAGNGSISVGPTGQGERWTSVIASGHCATNVREASAKVYAGNAAPSGFRYSSTWGSTGFSTGNLPPVLPVGQQVTIQWFGGDAGTMAYLSLSGTREVA